jgi:Trp operon repressor
VLASCGEKELRKFLAEFLTSEEKTMLAKRLTLYIMLLSDYSDAEIKEVLKMSYETIRATRGLLENKSQKFRDSLEHWVKKPNKERPTNRLLKFIELALAAKSDVKARAKLTSGEY